MTNWSLFEKPAALKAAGSLTTSMGLKIAILANLGQLTRDKFRAINA